MKKIIDITGKRYFDVVVKGHAGFDSTNKTTWNCICDCGNEFITTGLNLKSGNTKSCGCRRHKPQNKDITGEKFFRLTALEIAKRKNSSVWWRCKCDCGNETTVSYCHLSSGHTKSCGCYLRESSKKLAKLNLGGKKENHPRWRSNLTEDERANIRVDQPEWSKTILSREDYRCVKCNDNSYLHAHHLFGFAQVKERRNDLSNGVALCKVCHKDFHKKYGVTSFTRQDFYEWMNVPDPGDFSIIKSSGDFFDEMLAIMSKAKSVEELIEVRNKIDLEIQKSKGDQNA